MAFGRLNRWRGSAKPRQGSALEVVAAIAVYATLSFVFFGIPLLRGFAHCRLGYRAPGDAQIYIWGLAWYPYALSHRLDPLFTTAAWAPTGYNLAWSTTIPAAALLMWPVTIFFGPVVSYNLLCLLAPALSAFTAFLLCRFLAHNFWAAMAGGYVFGFSTYVASQVLDHSNLALVFLLPLIPYLCLLYVDRRAGRIGFVAALSVLLVGEFLLSMEVFATATFFGAVTLLLAFWLCDKALRPRLMSLARGAVLSYGIAIVLLSPYIVRLFPSPVGYFPVFNPFYYSTDALNFVLPVEPSLLAGVPWIQVLTAHIRRALEPTAYLGLLPLVAVLFAVGRPPLAGARLLTALLIITSIAALGPVLHFNGRPLFPIPWFLILAAPLLNSALPMRFTLYVFLVLAVILALWLSPRGGVSVGRWVLGSVALLSLLPVLPMTRYAIRENVPAFFERGLYKQYISAGEVVLILPYSDLGSSMLWQAVGNFGFGMAEGYLMDDAIPPGFAQWPIVRALEGDESDDPYIPEYTTQLLVFLAGHDIKTVIVNSADDAKFRALFEGIRCRRTEVGGVVLYQVDPAQFVPLRSLTAQEMEARYELDRFRLILHAVREAMDMGLDSERLSATELRRHHLLSAAVAGYDFPTARLPGRGVIQLLRRSRFFVGLFSRLIAHAGFRYLLMAELGMAPSFGLTDTGIWVGPWRGDRVGIGVIGDWQSLSTIIAEYAPRAEQILYPYPDPYRADEARAEGRRLLLMIFRRAVIDGLDHGASTSVAPAPGAICARSSGAAYALRNRPEAVWASVSLARKNGGELI